jgi:hypothetical protein
LLTVFEGDVTMGNFDPGFEGPRRERRGHRRGEEHRHVHGGLGPDFGLGIDPVGGPRGRGRAGRGVCYAKTHA